MSLKENYSTENYLFDPVEYTDPKVVKTMLGNTCRTCKHRLTIRQGHDGQNRLCVCDVRKSKLTKSGKLRVRVNQPACILFSPKQRKAKKNV